MYLGGVVGIESKGINVTGIQEGAVRNNTGVAPNGIQVKFF